MIYKVCIKRFLDFTIALIGILLLLPFFLLLSVLIKVDSKGTILFKQKRVGKNKKHFYILKFRTMRGDTPSNMPTHLLQDPDSYITRFGKLLRKTSLDELPQILNILKGEMSIVGPRPALWNQFDLIKERDKYYVNDVQPGLTGWAQINGRDEIPIVEKARLDGEYLRKMGFFFDVKICLNTVSSVLKRDGIREGKSFVDYSDS